MEKFLSPGYCDCTFLIAVREEMLVESNTDDSGHGGWAKETIFALSPYAYGVLHIKTK